MNKLMICPHCQAISGNNCSLCIGKGFIMSTNVPEGKSLCSDCFGQKVVVGAGQFKHACEYCEGLGYVDHSKVVHPPIAPLTVKETPLDVDATATAILRDEAPAPLKTPSVSVDSEYEEHLKKRRSKNKIIGMGE